MYCLLFDRPEENRSQDLPLAMRFRNLREKSSKTLFVRSSGIHGRGLYALKDFEKGELMIEYAGEVTFLFLVYFVNDYCM